MWCSAQQLFTIATKSVNIKSKSCVNSCALLLQSQSTSGASCVNSYALLLQSQSISGASGVAHNICALLLQSQSISGASGVALYPDPILTDPAVLLFCVFFFFPLVTCSFSCLANLATWGTATASPCEPWANNLRLSHGRDANTFTWHLSPGNTHRTAMFTL